MNTTPTAIGIIMDGNRRWAKERNLKTLEGHKAGYETFKNVGKWAEKAGVKYTTFYAFSTENWKRSKEEVTYLNDLFEKALFQDIDKLTEHNVCIRIIGQRDQFSKKLQERMKEVEQKSKNNTGITIIIAFSYGGRTEILEGVKRIAGSGKEITEEHFSEALWSAGVPDPDLIIRTGGEKRLSNFLTWQSVYSELFFSDTYWPDFSESEFMSILEEYGKRKRRHGA